MENVISQYKGVFVQLNKENTQLSELNMQLQRKLEKLQRSKMVMKSKLETAEENHKTQR